ncbi:MAG: ABC transporter substrate-binding protein [Halorhabdus sp.]
MRSRRSVLSALGAGVVVGLAGCTTAFSGTDSETTPASREVTDGFGRSVSIPATIDRVVGVGPGALRQIAYLDATDRVVGVEDEDESVLSAPYNQANPELREHPVIGSAGPDAGGNSEQILAVDPDVIFYYGEPSRADTLQSQTDTPVVGLRIVDVTDTNARETMYDTWRLVGDVLEKPERAETLISFLEETIEDLEGRTSSIAVPDRKRAYVGAISYKGAHGIATTRKRFPPFEWTAIENVASAVETDAPSVQVSSEQLLAWDPQTMFVSSANLGAVRDDVAAQPEYADLTAVDEGRTDSILPHASYNHNYGSILANAYFVGKTVYPDHFDDVTLESKTNDIFETTLGASLFDELTETYEAYRQLELP